MLKDLIITALEEMETSDLVSIHNNIASYDNSFDYIEYMDDIDDMNQGRSVRDIIDDFGHSDFSLAEDYYYYNGYGFAISFDNYEDHFYISELADWIMEHNDACYNSDLQAIFDEYDEEKIDDNMYEELTARHQKEFNDFPLGAAFSNEQFKVMMNDFGLTENDTDKIYSIGAGCYIRKIDADRFHEMTSRHNEELTNNFNNPDFCYHMFLYELENHEYSYTYEIDDTLDALGLTLEEIAKNEALKTGLNRALDFIKKYADYC